MSACKAIAELEDAVAELLAAAGLSDEAAPVDIKSVATWLGVEVREGTGGAEGCLRLREGRAVVEVSGWGSERRKRFTTAHELGHAYLLHPERSLSGRVCRRWANVEVFCNDFAACLLLPRAWLEQQVEQQPVSLATLARIAEQAQTSCPATSQRLVRGNLWSQALMDWQDEQRRWSVRAAPGLLSELRGRLALAPPTEQLLDRLVRRHGRGRLRVRLQVVIDGRESRELEADVELRTDGARMLVPVRFDGYGWEPRWREQQMSASEAEATDEGRVEAA